MPQYNNNLGKFFGPSPSYAGYVFIGCGIFASFYSLLALTLLIPGLFLAFTFDGILIDTENKRVKPYTALFGVIKTGNWISTIQFKRFSILRSTKKYTSYSRANIRFDMAVTDIELQMLNADGRKKIVLKKFQDFDQASRELENFKCLLYTEKSEA